MLLELDENIDVFKKQLSDILTLRHGWWLPTFWIYSKKDIPPLSRSKINKWLEARRANAQIVGPTHGDKNNIIKLKSFIQSQQVEAIVHLKSKYTPLILTDEVYRQCGELINKRKMQQIHFVSTQEITKHQVGFFRNSSGVRWDNYANIESLIQESLISNNRTLVVESNQIFGPLIIKDEKNHQPECPYFVDF